MKYIRKTPLENILCSWHESLEEQRELRASLRHSKTILEIITSTGFQDLVKRKGGVVGTEDWELTALAIVAGLLSRVKKHKPNVIFAQQLGSKGSNGKAVMSELRFKRLLSVKTPEEFYREMRRSLTFIDGETDVVALADDVYRWCHETQSYLRFGYQNSNPTECVRIRWALQYYDSSIDKETKAE